MWEPAVSTRVFNPTTVCSCCALPVAEMVSWSSSVQLMILTFSILPPPDFNATWYYATNVVTYICSSKSGPNTRHSTIFTGFCRLSTFGGFRWSDSGWRVVSWHPPLVPINGRSTLTNGSEATIPVPMALIPASDGLRCSDLCWKCCLIPISSYTWTLWAVTARMPSYSNWNPISLRSRWYSFWRSPSHWGHCSRQKDCQKSSTFPQIRPLTPVGSLGSLRRLNQPCTYCWTPPRSDLTATNLP